MSIARLARPSRTWRDFSSSPTMYMRMVSISLRYDVTRKHSIRIRLLRYNCVEKRRKRDRERERARFITNTPVGPRDSEVLLPPSTGHGRNVEAEKERDGQVVRVLLEKVLRFDEYPAT